jgi:hypothetical protein
VSLPSATATTITIPLAPDTTYRFRVRALDKGGYWSDWAYGNSFKVNAYQENNPAVSYQSGVWSSVASSGASGGYLKRSGSCPASAKFTFTGSGVALVAAKGPSGDKVAVTADGTSSTIDLYSAAEQSQMVFVKQWSSSASRSITISRLITGVTPKGMPTCTPYKTINVDAFRVLQ